MPPIQQEDFCALCGRQCPLTFHHLIPRQLHRRKHFQKHYSREQLHRGVWVCRACHNGIHRLFDQMTLGKELNTLEALRQNPELRRHCQWVAKQKTAAPQRL